MVSAVAWVLGLLDAVGSEPKGSDLRQCPAHPDSSPSLSLGVGDEQQVLLYCHAGCATEDVLAALQISFVQLHRAPPYSPTSHVRSRQIAIAFPPLRVQSHGGPGWRGFRLESLHQYGDHVLERWRHPATGAKELYWSTVDADGVLIPGLRDEYGNRVRTADLPLYLERDIRMAVGAGETVVVVESESSVDALVRAGVTATTWAGGAARPNLIRLAQILDGAGVLLVPDNDVAGLEAARLIWRALEPLTSRLECILPSPGQDARDLLMAAGAEVFRID
jgi:hypothetical protein